MKYLPPYDEIREAADETRQLRAEIKQLRAALKLTSVQLKENTKLMNAAKAEIEFLRKENKDWQRIASEGMATERKLRAELLRK